MIYLELKPLHTVADAQEMLQKAVGVEFGTLPPYLYALYSILPGTNAKAQQLIKSVALEEMIHMCLACNILNAIGGNPVIHVQPYPGPLPGDIGPNGKALDLHLYPFSSQAMDQAMKIEQPVDPPHLPIVEMLELAPAKKKPVTIGQFYNALDTFLGTLPDSAWIPNRNQLDDSQFFTGQIFAINSYKDAQRAIHEIVSEGEGTTKGTKPDPLDFQGEVAHYYRFGEIFYDKVLTKADNPLGYQWGPVKLGVDWNGAYPAIADPATHDFSKEPSDAQAAQNACNLAFSQMVDALQSAVTGHSGLLGQAVSAMFRLRMAALHAFTVPLADKTKVAGPAFLYKGAPK